MSQLGSIFLDKVVLLSSAVADADNHVMMHGKKLEVLSAIEQLLPQLTKPEIAAAQKKVEDLCLRILFQTCPSVLVRLIISVLSQLFSRGSSASMHACVAFLIQLSVLNPKDATTKLDRPVPGSEEDAEEPRSVSVQEKSVCLSVAIGIVVSRGPSASYFLPNILASVNRHIKLVDPAAREAALRGLQATMDVMGVPGTTVGVDVWKTVLYRSIHGEKSPQVRIAAAHALSVFCQKCPAVAAAHAETIQGICLKVILVPASQLKDQGLVGSLLVEARNAHVDVMVALLAGMITNGEKSEKTLNSHSISVKAVRNFTDALALILSLVKKYKAYPHAVEGLTTVAVRLALSLGAREEDLCSLAKCVLIELSPISPSVATRALNRVLRSCQGDSGVLRLLSEIVMRLVRQKEFISQPVYEQPICVALASLVEAMSIVEGSISALDSDLSTDLVQLISTTSSTGVAVSAAYALRALCRVCATQSFSLVTVLLNHITIQHAELQGSSEASNTAHLFVRSILHYSLALASVMCECAGQLPQDVAGAIVSTASALIGSEPEESVSLIDSKKKSCGFVLLVPIMCAGQSSETRQLTLLGLWKTVLGRKAKDLLAKQIAPGSVITDLGVIFESFQAVLSAMRSLHAFLSADAGQLELETRKLIILFLNNVWQLCQLAVPLEQSSGNPHVAVVVNGIRAELYKSFSCLDSESLESIIKPLVAFLSAEVLRDLPVGGRFSPSLLFDGIVSADRVNEGFLSSSLVDAADPVLEEVGDYDYLLSLAVTGGLSMIHPNSDVVGVGAKIPPVRDFYASSLAAGPLEDYYVEYPASPGSPYCPQLAYASHINSLCPLSAQMTHPVFDARLHAISLLAKLLPDVDASLFDACINVLYAGYKSVGQISSADYDEAKRVKESSISDSLGGCRASVIVAVVTGVFTKVLLSPSGPMLSDSGATTILSLAASPLGLGSLHPFTRRASAMVIAAVYTAKPGLRDLIFQCVTDSSVSATARSRAGTATLIGFLVDFYPSSIKTFGANLFKLARELSLPVRACALYAIHSACVSAKTSIAPWTRDILKVTMAHAVADVYPSPLASLLLAAVVASVWPMSSVSMAEASKCDLLWGELRFAGLLFGPGPWQNRAFAVATERFCVSFASQADVNSRHGKFVMDQIRLSAECHSAVCRGAIVGLTEIAEQGSSRSLEEGLFDSLFTVSDANPQLRREVNQLLKVLLRVHGVEALPLILKSLGSDGAAKTDQDGDEDGGVDEDEYGSEGEGDSSHVTKEVQSASQSSKKLGQMTLSTRSLILKCLKRILKSDAFRKRDCVNCLDRVISVAVSAVSGGGETNAALAVQGAKLLKIVIDLFGDDIDPRTVVKRRVVGSDDEGDAAAELPLLLQFETQIVAAIRKGVRMNSDASTTVQKYCLEILKTVLEKGLTTASDRLVELLLQPLVLVDPATMPWSSYFALREAGNTIISGRSALAQTNEKEVSVVLYTRMAVIVDLIDRAYLNEVELNSAPSGTANVPLAMLRKHSAFVHYFLVRMLMDCAAGIGGSSTNLFSLLSSDLSALQSTINTVLVPTVLNGLVLTKRLEWGHLTAPTDCPSSDVDVEALYCGVAVAAAAAVSTVNGMAGLARAAEMVCFDLGYEPIMDLFDVQCVDTPTSEPRLILLAHKLTTLGEYSKFATNRKNTVWNICKLGLVGQEAGELWIRRFGDVVHWLISRGCFDTRQRADQLMVDCLFPLVQKQPQTVVKILRDAVSEVRSPQDLLFLLESVDSLLQTPFAPVQFVVVLLIPIFTRLVALVGEHPDQASVESALTQLRASLMTAAVTAPVPIIQCVGKLLLIPAMPFVVTQSLLLPVSLELLTLDSTNCLSLLVPLVGLFASHKQEPEWKQLVLLILSLANECTEEASEETIARSVIACMQPIDVFRDALTQLSSIEKSKVESLVRKFLPKAAPRDPVMSGDSARGSGATPQSGTPPVSSVSAPQIQLKLKFGK